MNWRTKQMARAGVTALGVAGGLMLLATTGQTTDGFVHANFGSPLGIFGAAPADSQVGVMAIGDGSSDATELASLLNVSGTTTAKPGPFRVAFAPGDGPNAAEMKVFPTADPAAAQISDQSLAMPNKPVVDAQGRIDCTGSLSCQTDPATNITTVTYPDGVVALVQKINDTTVVAYKTVTSALPSQLQNLFPQLPAPAPMPAAAAPAPSSAPAPATEASEPAPVTADPTAAPVPDISAATIRPRLTVTSPPSDYAPGKTGTVSGNPLQLPSSITNPVDVVKDAVGSVVNAIGGIVNDALKPNNHSSNRTKAPSAPSN
ncbi:MAG: hypothetical protein ACOYBX_10010 [Mycobacterium sp.]